MTGNNKYPTSVGKVHNVTVGTSPSLTDAIPTNAWVIPLIEYIVIGCYGNVNLQSIANEFTKVSSFTNAFFVEKLAQQIAKTSNDKTVVNDAKDLIKELHIDLNTPAFQASIKKEFPTAPSIYREIAKLVDTHWDAILEEAAHLHESGIPLEKAIIDSTLTDKQHVISTINHVADCLEEYQNRKSIGNVFSLPQ